MRILVVDDEVDCLDDVQTALVPTGYTVETLTNPITALEKYKSGDYDVVISDIRMPEMDGIELLKRIREFDSEARVIIMTAYGDLNTAVSAINNKAYSFFGKPINFQDLVSTLRQIESELVKKQKIDVEQLKSEYDNLKNAYSELMNFVESMKGK